MDLQFVPALFVSSVHPVVAPAEIFHCLTSEARFPWRTSTGLVSETQQKKHYFDTSVLVQWAK